MTADLFLLPHTENWMTPLRDNLKRFLTLQGCKFEREKSGVPVVTYINRYGCKTLQVE
jgi:hypothetical protein